MQTKYITDYKNVNQSILDKSEFMDTIQGQSIYDIHQAIQKITADPTLYESSKLWANEHVYFMQSATQNVVNTIVWVGAYDQGIEQGMTEKEAVRHADSVVRTTQGTVSAEDISRFEVGTAGGRLFTMFASYFNMLANLNAAEFQKIQRDVGLKKGAGRAFYVYMMGIAIPAILSTVIVRALSGKGADADDDDSYLDDFMEVFFGSQVKTVIAAIPYGGSSINALMSVFDDQPWNDRISISPVVSSIESAVKAPAEVYKAINGDTDAGKKVVRDSLNLLGIASRLPIGPIGRPVGYLMDVSSGKAEPTGPIDYTRGLITGAPGKP